MKRPDSIPLFSHGIRPFFLGAGIWAVVGMATWLASLTGHFNLDPSYGMLAWHAHAFLYGYLGAVIVGFLLTAGPNWTGCESLHGWPLAGLFSLWVLARIAGIYFSEFGILAAIIDTLLLIIIATWFGWQIIAARDWLNLRIVAIISALAASNIYFHWEVLHLGAPDASIRLVLMLIMSLIMVIAGRLIPTFTKNWMVIHKRKPYPPLFDRVDAIAIALGIAGLFAWTVRPRDAVTGTLLIIGGLGQFARLVRWRGIVAMRDPLIVILHAGYLFLVLGFLATGVSVLDPDLIPPSGAMHAWTAGAIGVMTLGVMTRVSLIETGRPPRPPKITWVIYGSAVLSALIRIAAPMTSRMMTMLTISALLWIATFMLFVLVYGPYLLKPGED